MFHLLSIRKELETGSAYVTTQINSCKCPLALLCLHLRYTALNFRAAPWQKGFDVVIQHTSRKYSRMQLLIGDSQQWGKDLETRIKELDMQD